jgi:hypothetical protein
LECGDSSPLSFFLSFAVRQRAAPLFCLIIAPFITPLKNGQKRSRFGEEKAVMNHRTPKEKKERKAAMNRRTPKGQVVRIPASFRSPGR